MSGVVFTLPVVDLDLPGPLPLVVRRSYSSDAIDRDVGLGPGWRLSLSWHVEIGRRELQLFKGDGTSASFMVAGVGDVVLGVGGWLCVRRGPHAVDVQEPGGRRYSFEATDWAQGPRVVLPLVAISDAFGNTIRLEYTHRRLARVVDCVGREVQLRWSSSNRMTAIDVREAESGTWLTMCAYEHDGEGDLRQVRDADGHVTEHTYRDHRLKSMTNAVGLRFEYRYDAQGRCTETWGAPADRSPLDCLSPRAPTLLGDGSTPARGIFHCRFTYSDDGMTEVVDSIGVQHIEADAEGRIAKAVHGGGVYTRTYDDFGHVASFTDALGATTSWTRDERGRELSIVDPLARTTLIEREPDGNIRRVTDPAGGATNVERNGRRLCWTDPLGARFEVALDERGQTIETVAPTGARTRYKRDAHGNIVERIGATGLVTQCWYDGLGRMVARREATGAVTQLAWSRGGKLLSRVDANGGVTRYEHNGVGDLTAITWPDGQTERHHWSGFHFLHATTAANGTTTRWFYDREGRIADVHDAAGRVHSLERNSRGLVVREVEIGGRVLDHSYDLLGRLVATRVNGGRLVELEYDAVGQMVARRYDDGADLFTYDELGRVVRVEMPGGVFEYAYNAIGWLVRETHHVDGETTTIEVAYDTLGRPTSRRTNGGREVRWKRDEIGRAEHVELTAGQRLAFRRNEHGQETAWSLPGGGRVQLAYDPLGRLLSTRVEAHAPDATASDGRPRSTATVSRSYRYNGESEPVEIQDSRLGDTRITHDPSGQVTGRVRDQALRDFSYDASGNLYETGAIAPRREYGSGNRLERIGSRTYRWGEDAHLAEVRDDGPGPAPRRSSLTWNAAGQLSEVALSDGRSVRFVYDPWARRVAKTTTLPDGAVEHTRYVWHGEALAQEIKRTTGRDGNPVVEERSYLFDDDASRPLAHCQHRDGRDEWVFYVTDDLGTPCHLVRDDGSLVASPALDVWGEPLLPSEEATTPFRFRGQYADAETGLYYNRYRYYAPEAGRYISPDPLGIYVGPNAFTYADNCPTTLLDPQGLMPLSTITQPGRDDITGRSGQVPQRDNDDRNFNPAVGAAHENALALNPGGNAGCAEIAALHAMGNQVRDDLAAEGRGTGPRGTVTRADVRGEMRERFRNGARISTNNGGNGKGPAMCPCPVCSQTMRELGIHPENIGEGATGGVQAPNPGRPARRGLWDGQSEWLHNGNNPVEDPTQPSCTTPATGT